MDVEWVRETGNKIKETGERKQETGGWKTLMKYLRYAQISPQYTSLSQRDLFEIGLLRRISLRRGKRGKRETEEMKQEKGKGRNQNFSFLVLIKLYNIEEILRVLFIR